MEVRIDVPDEYFTAQWYAQRGRGPHLEQPIHAARFEASLDMVTEAISRYRARSIVDLGCGDGGLLSLIRAKHPEVPAWGYDLQPSNVEPARNERLVDARYGDFLTEDVEWGDCAVITECLEHVDNPRAVTHLIARHARVLVASSPASETAESHDQVHVWVWDAQGYRKVIEDAGFEIVEHRITSGQIAFQVVLAVLP